VFNKWAGISLGEANLESKTQTSNCYRGCGDSNKNKYMLHLFFMVLELLFIHLFK
jgi:hypothetical protein